MGLGIGAGLVAGARLSSTSVSLALMIGLVSLLVLWLVLHPSARPVVLCIAGGVGLGWMVASLVGAGAEGRYVVPPSTGFEAVVTSDPRGAARGTHAHVEWQTEGQHGTAHVFFPASLEVGRGDRVWVQGRVNLDGWSPTVFVGQARIEAPAGRVERMRRAVRSHAEAAMVEYVPGSAGSLTLGLLIGNDTFLSGDEREDLRASGLAHITAVSGWNVSVVVITVGSVFRAFGARRWRWLVVQAAFLGMYVWIVGLEPPIVRAAIMGALALVALQLGRPSHMITLLVLAAGVMAVLDPLVLESLSFHLSFMSMIGLAVAARICRDVEGWKAVIATPTVAAATAGVATAPLLAHAFGSMPLLTVPANLLAGPIVPVATFSGVVVVLGTWIPPVAEVVGWANWSISRVILAISSTMAGVPGGHRQFTPISAPATIAIYIAMLGVSLPFFAEGRRVLRQAGERMTASPYPAAVSGVAVLVVVFLGWQVGT